MSFKNPFQFLHSRSKKDSKNLILIFLIIIGIAIAVSLSLQPQLFNKRAATGTLIDLKFAPETVKVETGKIYEVKIAINPKASKVTTAKLNLEYNPTVISIVEVNNSGFLPIELKEEDSFEGNLTLIYGSTIDSVSDKPGILSSIKFKVLNAEYSEIKIGPDSEVTITSLDGNALESLNKVDIEPALGEGTEPVSYPDSLLLEKAFFQDSEPVVREFTESLTPQPYNKPPRLRPEFSIAYVQQLGQELLIDPIIALNQVLEEKTGEIISRSEE